MNPSKAEQLMRARYTAYVKKKRDFILDTWDEKSRPKFLSFEKDLKWQNLEIISTRLGAEFDEEGWVEFKAYFKQNKKKSFQYENSYFRKIDGKWIYFMLI